MNQAQALQTLATRLIERGFSQEMFCHFEGFLRLGLRAQAQSRLALEAIGAIKHGPAVLARTAQVNVAHGPQQVNNGAKLDCAPITSAREALESSQSKLLSEHGSCLDTGKAREAGAGDQTLAPVGAKHRAAKR